MKKTIIFSTILLFNAMLQAQDFSEQTKQNNEFCFEFYSYVSNSNDNLFVSPFSVSTALAMTYEGAQEKTREEMSRVLHFHPDSKTINKSFSEIISRVKSSKDAENYTLNIANSIWAQKDFDFLQSFFNTIKEYYDAPVELVDFKDENNREKVRIMINDWTAKKTNDKIKDLLDKSALDHDTKMVLVNAVYFLAEWKKAFQKESTKEDIFFSAEGEVKKDFMKQSSRYQYTRIDSVQMLEIPYKNDKASMLVIIPDKLEQFKNLTENCNFAYYTSLAEKADSLPDKTFSVELADGSVFKASGQINFENYTSADGKCNIQLIPTNEWTPFLE